MSALGIWRPPQWNGPAMVSVTVPSQSSNIPTTQTNQTPSMINGTLTFKAGATTQITPAQVYVFDAVFTLEHEQRLEKTRHPVQTGSDISSHAYLLPARVSMYIGMSDAQDSYTGPNVQPWNIKPSKSVSAYQQMIALQAARALLIVTTRLRTYTNMVVTSVGPTEDFRTIKSLRMRIEFEQIFTAATASAPVSARPNDTATTGLGTVNSQTPNASLLTQFSAPATGDPTVDVPGSGDLTSNLGNGGVIPA